MAVWGVTAQNKRGCDPHLPIPIPALPLGFRDVSALVDGADSSTGELTKLRVCLREGATVAASGPICVCQGRHCALRTQLWALCLPVSHLKPIPIPSWPLGF